MSSNQDESGKIEDNVETEDNDEAERVLQTKNILPEDYECQSCVMKEKKYDPSAKLDETICRTVPANKLNETLKKQKCSHCGEALGKCRCLSDEARKELTKIHRYEREDTTEQEVDTEDNLKQ